jgi:hypothetical protein
MSKHIIKTFLIEDFFHLPPLSTTPVMHIELKIKYLHEFSKKLETTILGYSGAWRKLIHDKKPLSRKSCGTVTLSKFNLIVRTLLVQYCNTMPTVFMLSCV